MSDICFKRKKKQSIPIIFDEISACQHISFDFFNRLESHFLSVSILQNWNKFVELTA